jgi:transposase
MQEEARSEILPTTTKGVAEDGLVEQGMAEAIRQMRAAGMANKAIAREMGIDVKTVRKWGKTAWKVQTRTGRASKLDPFKGTVEVRFPEVGYNAVVLHRELREAGYEGSYVALQRYVRPLRMAARPETATMRFETAPGAQAQADWSLVNVWIGEEKVKVHLFVMVLGYSRRIFARGYLHERLGNLLEGHEAAFAHFGGRTETILYDNPRTIVLSKDEAAGTVQWNRRFKDRMDFYGVEVKLCRYYRAQTKGKVENGVKYVQSNALAGRRFATLEQLNAWLETWCLTIADERTHGTTHEVPRERFERDERVRLIAVDGRPPSRECDTVRRKVSRDGFVEVDTNRYPVDYAWCAAEVEVQRSVTEVRIVHEGESIVHDRSAERHRVLAWDGPPRELRRGVRASLPDEPPRYDPAWLATIGSVSVRGLDAYAAVAEEVGR